MALTDSAIKALAHGERVVRKADGGGLYLEVSPRGSKVFRLAYRFGGKQRTLALGPYRPRRVPIFDLGQQPHRRRRVRGLSSEMMRSAADRHREETRIERSTIQYALARGWRQRKMAFVGRRGCPDRWFMRGDNALVIIEFKDPDGKLSVAQAKEVNWLMTNGFNVHVIDNMADGKAVFDAWDEPQ